MKEGNALTGFSWGCLNWKAECSSICFSFEKGIYFFPVFSGTVETTILAPAIF
jgi:hypothetical protein